MLLSFVHGPVAVGPLHLLNCCTNGLLTCEKRLLPYLLLTFDRRLRCTADGHEVHSYLEKPFPMRQLTFAVPRAATADGELTLSFTQDYPDNLGECTVRTISPRWCSTGDGRGNSVRIGI
eukprot:COSAG05_NODE_7_length_42457_cov_58.929152_15_plen_120_part_00